MTIIKVFRFKSWSQSCFFVTSTGYDNLRKSLVNENIGRRILFEKFSFFKVVSMVSEPLRTTLGFAKNPMIRRIPNIDNNIPVWFIYGGRSWIDHTSGFNSIHLRQNAIATTVKVFFLQFINLFIHFSDFVF